MSSQMDDAKAVGPGTRPVPCARPRGRPRSAAAERAILDATLRLIGRHRSVGAVSVEAVAQEAGVGKATIYRRWSNKEALVIAAVEAAEQPIPELDGVNVRDDLIRLLTVMRQNMMDRRAEGLVSLVLGEVGRHPELHRRYHEVVIERRREAMRVVLRRGVATGELRGDVPIELMKDLLTGPLLIRKMVDDLDIPAELPELIVDTVLHGVAAGAAETTR
ncbi:TetR/AcrR family transcriptional regulator [Yinghuangia sp. ASG 101]|uniref:TetR/AcrR family transcriptional regulator n=1 Tax=Yinghuangia sp. ASG 101 TaxID=2896848 RepID=UPI001E56E858|nr:TetR/AcrR family transcriptional regulator [Yinghuangia sp. ASG 101]UGQ09937.1 TetR/AcrR family transcriptional regulator [Yinghuangia sp. ASG 101]